MEDSRSFPSIDIAHRHAPIILLVEDDPADEALAVRMLRDDAHIANDVIVVRDGGEAVDFLLAVARDGNALPLCVLLDITLPGLDGFETLQRLRAERTTAHVPVVVLLSESVDEDELHRRKLETWSTVRKPLDIGRFIAAVRRLGLSWMVMNVSGAATTAMTPDPGVPSRFATSTPTR